MISVRFQGKPFSIRPIQVYAPTTKTKEGKQFYEDLQDLLIYPFHYRGLECVNLTQMTIISTTVGKNPLEEMK